MCLLTCREEAVGIRYPAEEPWSRRVNAAVTAAVCRELLSTEKKTNPELFFFPFQMGGETPEAPITFVLRQQVRNYTCGWKKPHTYTTIYLLRYELCFIILRQGLFLTTEVVERYELQGI